MESNNWRSAQADSSSMEAPSADWRSHLQPDARQRIVNKIMDTLKRHLPVVGAEGMGELKKIALRFEEKIYSAAVNQSDYLRRISMKMLSMETKTQQNTSMNPQPGINQNSTDTGLQGPSQMNNQGKPLSQIPMVSQPPGRQQLLAQNMQNNAPSSMMGSSSLSATSSLTGLSQSNLNYGHASNMQNMPGMSHGAVNNSLSQGTTTDIYGNAQRQMQNRQQQQQSILSQQQQQQQQSQNALLYQNQLPPQIMNQKMHNNAHIQSIQQQQQQPQSLFQANQLQSSQQSVMQMPSGQSSIQQSQATAIQSAPQSSLQQNQLNSIQQSVTSLLPQHMHAISRQSQQPLSSVHQQNSLQQQSAATHQQSNLQTQQQQQQQQLLGQQANMSNIQQNQMLSQQNNIVDIKPQQQQQQQRLPSQQNNLVSMQQSQQSLNQQSMSLHQQQQPQSQQQQLLGSLQNASNMQQHQRSMQLLQQSKNMSQTQQQLQQPSMALMQSQGQQSHLLSSQQKLMPQFQSQSGQLQQQLAMQQQPNSIQRDMQQRLQLSGGLLQSQTAMEQQKPFMQSQRGIPEVSSSTSIDSTAQTGQNGADWQEEAYQKIQSMKEAHFAELQDFHLKITLKVQQPDLTPQAKQSENYEKLKSFKQMLDRLVAFLQISKSNITPNLKEKLPTYEKQLINMLASNRRQKVMTSQQEGHQQHFQLPVGNSQSTPQHQQSQVMQAQQQDNNGNQAQQMNMSSAVPSSMQHGAMTLSSLAAPAAQQNITNSVQAASDLDPVQVSAFGSLQQGSMGSVQHNGLSPLQNSVSTTHQNNLNNMSQNSMNLLQANNPALQSSNVLQQQHLKQQEQLMQRQQLQQRQIQQQQLLQQQQQRQQLLQTQQLPQQQKQQQPSQMPVHQMSQHHPMNEINELKARQGAGIKPGPQSYPGGQRPNYYHQQLKPGSSFPISSPQNLLASSPQISHNSSPQIDQHALLPILTKNGTPVQSTGSPFVVPSPSTPIAPSPIPGDSEKLVSSAPSHQTGGRATLQQPAQVQAISVATPGILASASPLLAEFTSQEGNLPNSNTMLRTSASERPLERLIKAIQSVSPKALSSAVSDITSVVSMIDRIAGSAPGNGSRAAVGEDLVAMTKCRLQARNFMSQDGGAAVKKMKRHTSAMPLNNVSSPGSVNDNFMRLNSLDMETTATSRFKRQKFEGNRALEEEIREINRRLIDTVVSICDEDSDSAAAASEGSEGVIVKCSYTAVALSPSLKAHFASMHLSPIAPLRLLVPANYPNSSPLLLDKLQPEPSKECEDLHIKAKSRFSLSLRGLSQPMSLGEMAGKWDACARKVIVEYAEQMDGGSFSSTYGTWENCVGA